LYLLFLLQQLLVTMSRSGKEEKMSRKNGKKLLIVIAVGAVVIKAVRDVIKTKKQEEALKTALMCGIEKGDWLNERKLQMMQEELSESDSNREAQLLYGNSDKYGIYQLKDDPELDKFRFEGTESLKRMGITKDNFDAVLPENYKLVYMGELAELQGQTQSETLEAIYTKFNIDHPADYKAHSLSVSDIVVLHEDGENSAHFVDSFVFTELPKFMLTLEGRENEI
jgi:hypothetical protein